MIVEAPSSLLDEIMFEILLTMALKTPLASTPGWEKKFLSSADKNELIKFYGIALKGTKIILSLEKSATRLPLPE